MRGKSFHSIHKITVMDMKRNAILKVICFLAFAVCFCMLILGNGTTEKSRWLAYAVFLYITALSIPLIYYARYGGKNKRIIACVIKTKLTDIKLYDALFGFYCMTILVVDYGILALATGFKYPADGKTGVCLFLSVMAVLWILNRLCLLSFKIFKSYFAGTIVYVAVSMLCFVSNNVMTGFFYPDNGGVLGIQYFAGKLLELFIVEIFLFCLEKCKN